MTKITVLMIVCLTIISCSKENDGVLIENINTSGQEMERFIPSGNGECTESKNLIAGQNYIAGTVVYELNSNNDLIVTYTTLTEPNGDYWVIDATHLYVGLCGGVPGDPEYPSAIPTNNPGNPRIGQFPYKSTESDATSVVWVIPTGTFPSCGCIAAHAELSLYDASGNIIQQETGWADGDQLPGNSWAMFFDYCVTDCI